MNRRNPKQSKKRIEERLDQLERDPKQLANQVKERMDQLERDPKTMQEIEDFQRQFGCVTPQILLKEFNM